MATPSKRSGALYVEVDGAAIRAAREAAGLSQRGLAEKVGVARRTIWEYEHEAHPAELARVSDVATALRRPVAELTRGVVPRGAPRASKAKREKPEERGAEPAPWINGKRAPRSTLERGVEAERALPAEKPAPYGNQKLEVLCFRRLQAIYTAFRVRDGERYLLEGVVDRDRGASIEEAAELGSQNGVAARFGVIRRIAGLDLEVTVHAATAEHTRALQDRNGRPARMVVRVHACRGEAVFLFFVGAGTPRPWTLVVVDVLA